LREEVEAYLATSTRSQAQLFLPATGIDKKLPEVSCEVKHDFCSLEQVSKG